jgi:serine/threonine protein phosphatase PrpC
MKLEIAQVSKTGGRPQNEDACGVWSGEDACFCVLSDGAGGHGGGAVASKLAVKHVLQAFQQTPDCSAAALQSAMRRANDAIGREQTTQAALQSMRATAVVLAVDTRRLEARWGHLGDSRLYCLRGSRILEQTRDHSVVQSMVDAGYVPMESLRSLPERSKLLAALGDSQHFVPAISPKPHAVRGGDLFLLCSDGFWEHVEEAEIEASAARAVSAEGWLRDLEGQVTRKGGVKQDNYSAIVVRCVGAEGRVAPR